MSGAHQGLCYRDISLFNLLVLFAVTVVLMLMI